MLPFFDSITTATTMKNETIGLVLSGGGIRGLAHVGFLRALRETGIRIDYLSGSSAGALVGALHAMHYDSQEILEVFAEVQLYSYNRFTWRKLGLLDTETFIPHLRRFFPIDSFSILDIPLTITMTDVEAGRCEYVSEGEIIRPLLASAAYPPTLSPMQIDGRYYMDGGVMDNFPVYPLYQKVDILLGSHVCPMQTIDYEQISNSGQLAWRAINLGHYAASQDKFDRCDFVFQPTGIEEIGVFDNKLAQRVYEIGYEQAQRAMPTIQSVLEKKRATQDVSSSQQQRLSMYRRILFSIRLFR